MLIRNSNLQSRTLSMFLISIFFIIHQCFMKSSFQQFLDLTPSTFGLITVTHQKSNDFTYLKKHLDRYGLMDCPEISQISIVWNNDINVQEANIINSQWKRPVYFVKTPFNSMDFRYTIPNQSKATVYFSIDDDVQIQCENLKKSFAEWKKYAIGDIGPPVTFGPCGYDFNGQKQSYSYTSSQGGNYYSSNLIGISWVPRFFFQIYNSLELKQIKQIRKIVQQKNNCDDIALNHFIYYFFPEFLVHRVYLGYRFQERPKGQSSQSLKASHYENRSLCFKEFNQILGINPLKHTYTKRNELQSYKSITKQYSIYLKRKQLEKIIRKQNISHWLRQIEQQFSNIFYNRQRQIDDLIRQQLYLYEQIDLEIKKRASNPDVQNVYKLFFIACIVLLVNLFANIYFQSFFTSGK